MSKKIFRRITALIAALVLVMVMNQGQTAFATTATAFDYDYLYSTLMVGDLSYARELMVSGTVQSFMADDADGVAIYVPDDMTTGTGTGWGFYRQEGSDYCIYYGEFVNCDRQGHGTIYDTYTGSENKTWTEAFYGIWEADYPNGPGNETYSYEDAEMKLVLEASGTYVGNTFSGTFIFQRTVYNGSEASTCTASSTYLNSYLDGIYSYNANYQDGETISISVQFSGGYPVNDRTSEYLGLFGQPSSSFNSDTGCVVGWTDNGKHGVWLNKPTTYFTDYTFALD